MFSALTRIVHSPSASSVARMYMTVIFTIFFGRESVSPLCSDAIFLSPFSLFITVLYFPSELDSRNKYHINFKAPG